MKNAGPAGRRTVRQIGRGFLWLVLAYAATLAFGMPFAWPFDYVTNAGSPQIEDAMRVPADGKRRVVVLQHGMWRSSLALLRIERTLAAHGYEVHNLDYPSTRERIEDHAARLHAAVEQIHASGPVDELSFVGHSMGGIVIEEYLRRPDARPTASCVYIATPHHGAVLADLRKHWFLFRLAMGTKASLQLSPGDPMVQQEIPQAGPSGVIASGTIVGDLGDGNASIPGRDDGTVGIGEATFAGATDSITLPFGHTRIAYDPATARQVLHFLRTGAFAPAGQVR
jgi:triacylglycerol lipase